MTQELEKVVLKAPFSRVCSDSILTVIICCLPLLLLAGSDAEVKYLPKLLLVFVLFVILGVVCILSVVRASRTKIEIGMAGVEFHSPEGTTTFSWAEMDGCRYGNSNEGRVYYLTITTREGVTKNVRIDGMKTDYVLEQIHAFEWKRGQIVNSSTL